MSLPSSGALSISMIKTELGSGNNSLRALSAQAGFSTPDAISEFYGYTYATNSGTLYYVGINTSANPVEFTGTGAYTDACSLSGMSSRTVYYNGALGNGTRFFYNQSGARLISDGGIYSMNGYYFQLDGDTVYGFTACPAAASCSISGSVSISSSISSASGTIYITGTKSVRLSCFGGAGTGYSFACTLSIASVGTYNLSCSAYQTKNQDISLSAGTYTYYLTRNSYTGSAGNNASISCL